MNEALRSLPTKTAAQMRAALLAGGELALLDIREEAVYARGHPLFAAQLSLSRIELDAYARIPRLSTPIVVYDDGEGYAARAAVVLRRLGYSDVSLLEDGLGGWSGAGGELFRDVNVPSKAFGEWLAVTRNTPELEAAELQSLQNGGADLVVLDARRFDEYQTMSIPGAISVPGAELVLRVGALAPDANTRVVVNCAGRTRSLIGAQSLINAGIANPVTALRNGTIGWKLAGQDLEHGQQRRFDETVDPDAKARAAALALAVARRAGVLRLSLSALRAWLSDSKRTTYCFDVRSEQEFTRGHLPGFRPAPGGQLVQELDHFAPVRGARVVLVDDDGVRANMTASWLAQMGWEVAVIDGLSAADFSASGPFSAPQPLVPQTPGVSAAELARWLRDNECVVLDFTVSANYLKRHIPGAYFLLRAQLPELLPKLPRAARYVLTCGSSALARWVAADLRALCDVPLFVLNGGTQAWLDAGLPVEQGPEQALSPAIDRYRRPYEGRDNDAAAMRDYLDWEFGLVEQLARDNTHRFFAI